MISPRQSHLGPDQWDLLDRYLSGHCTAAEAGAAETLLADQCEVREVVDVLERDYDPQVPAPELTDSWEAIQRRLSGDATRHPRRQVVAPGRSRSMWYALAGVTAGILGIAAGWRLRGESRSPGIGSSSAIVATYATTNGQRATITLADGSTVTLNVGSRLEVPADYVAGNRTVRLSGEALFTVRRHTGAPFTVFAGTAIVRVLGTSFVVRHYATDTGSTVAVRDGKVAVQATVLTAAQQAEVNGKGLVRVSAADPSWFGFATGVLTLKGVPFPAAITELDRWYDADVRLGDPALSRRRVAGEFSAGSRSDLANILELMFDARVVREGRVLTLYPR